MFPMFFQVWLRQIDRYFYGNFYLKVFLYFNLLCLKNFNEYVSGKSSRLYVLYKKVKHFPIDRKIQSRNLVYKVIALQPTTL